MYIGEEILEQKFNILTEYLKKSNLECKKIMTRDYLIKIEILEFGQFNLYYKPTKSTFTPKQGTLDSKIYNNIVNFINSGWIIDDTISDKKKYSNKELRSINHLKHVYEIISEYKNYNIEFDILIDAIKPLCTKEEYEYLKNNDTNFDLLKKFALRYIEN